MDHLVSDYFHTLAQVAIGFVGFSTIAVVLRQMIGRPLDAYQTLLVRYVIECGLAATIFSLAPVLLAVAGLSAPTLWRVSSAALGIFGLVYPAHYVHRRRRAKPGALPRHGVWIYLGTIAVVALLWLNVFTPIFRWSAGPYALGVTWLLLQSAVILVFAFGEFMRKES